ncbi:Os10g0138700 [Oryza sativa Japonica Group]|uniref:Os10g0138700 protein n=1 Tax=Oryza sativa subsp. japonica TaxID=39947 RepID=A0A0P0XRJ1_ORYSJ|nr:Os10g0138700 [Oryza sativa Japonica Group]
MRVSLELLDKGVEQASPWVVDYYVYNSDDGEEDRDDDDYGDKTRAISPIMQHNNEASGSQSPWWSDLWCDKDFHQDNDAPIPVISANVNVIGFVEEANAVLLHAAGRGVHVIDIETKDTQRVAACAYYSHVFAYISFNTAAGKTVISDPTFPNQLNNHASGAKAIYSPSTFSDLENSTTPAGHCL